MKYILSFMLPIAVLAVVGEAVVESYPNSYRYKNEWMQEHAAGVKTLLLGASHMYAGVNPALLGDSTFNLSNVSQHYEHDYFLLTKYAPSLTSLSTVLLTIDDSMVFDPPLEDDVESYRASYYTMYMGHDKHSRWSQYGLELCHFAAFREKLNKAVPALIKGNAELDCDSLGFATTFPTAREFNEKSMSLLVGRTLERHRCKDRSLVAENAHYIELIAQWCQQYGVRLVLVSTPLWDKYYQAMDPWTINTMDSIAKQYCTRYVAQYCDYMKDSRFSGVDFYDVDHLSQQGAERLTAILKSELF